MDVGSWDCESWKVWQYVVYKRRGRRWWSRLEGLRTKETAIGGIHFWVLEPGAPTSKDRKQMILPRTRGWVSWFFSPPFVYKNSQSIGWCQPARSEAVSIFTHRLISSVTTLTGSHIKIPLSVICVSFDTIKQAHKSSHHARERQYFF